MAAKPHRQRARAEDTDFELLSMLDVYLEEWQRLTPRERLRRSWAMRRRIPDLEAVHDAKLPHLS